MASTKLDATSAFGTVTLIPSTDSFSYRSSTLPIRGMAWMVWLTEARDCLQTSNSMSALSSPNKRISACSLFSTMRPSTSLSSHGRLMGMVTLTGDLRRFPCLTSTLVSPTQMATLSATTCAWPVAMAAMTAVRSSRSEASPRQEEMLSTEWSLRKTKLSDILQAKQRKEKNVLYRRLNSLYINRYLSYLCYLHYF